MNQGCIYREVVRGRDAGQAIERYLAGRYAHTSFVAWTEHVAAGRLRLDGEAAAVGQRLQEGQRLEWHRPPWQEPEAPLHFDVLFDEGGVLVVHKPAGLPTLAGGGFLEHSLLHQLRLRHPQASPAHRLGRWTSGAVLCSRGGAVGAHLAAQFARRSTHKVYAALASGSPKEDRFDVDVPIGPVPYPPLGRLHAACPDGRPASSSVVVTERRPGAFLCDVSIATGRPHQIRVHLAAAGHPLVGDPLYVVGGGPAVGGQALPGDPGYSLHSEVIGFEHPRGGAWIEVRAPRPALLRPGA